MQGYSKGSELPLKTVHYSGKVEASKLGYIRASVGTF
jgi:hypothetical protein